MGVTYRLLLHLDALHQVQLWSSFGPALCPALVPTCFALAPNDETSAVAAAGQLTVPYD